MNNINYNTEIDTVALQLEFDSPLEQRDSLSMLANWIRGRKLGCLKYDKNLSASIRVHTLYFANSKIATFSTGVTKIKINGVSIFRYYIRIRIAGLKNYNLLADSSSYSTLITIAAYLNTTSTSYRFVELDVCIDVSCPFNNMLAICTKKTARTEYKQLGSVYEASTSYIEHFKDKNTRKQATKRAYVYDKQVKEGLSFPLTRFEIKLQNNWFLHNKLNADLIINTMNRYHVMYFNDLREKQLIIHRYNNYAHVTSREILQLNLNNYRLYPNGDVITEFIRQVQSAYVDFYGVIVVPPKDLNLQ